MSTCAHSRSLTVLCAAACRSAAAGPVAGALRLPAPRTPTARFRNTHHECAGVVQRYRDPAGAARSQPALRHSHPVLKDLQRHLEIDCSFFPGLGCSASVQDVLI